MKLGSKVMNNIALINFTFHQFRPTFVRIVKKKSVEEYSPIPYLATLINCLVWVLYGLPMVHPDSTLVVTINGTGIVIEIVFLTIFFCFMRPKKTTVGYNRCFNGRNRICGDSCGFDLDPPTYYR